MLKISGVLIVLIVAVVLTLATDIALLARDVYSILRRIIADRLAVARWNAKVRTRRANHPDLMRQLESGLISEDDMVERMLDRDRKRIRNLPDVPKCDARYPQHWDYEPVSGVKQLRLVRDRFESRAGTLRAGEEFAHL